MVITWVTFSPTEKSQVQYGVHSSVLNETVDGVVTKFEDGALTRYIHRVTLQGLAPLTKYGKCHNHHMVAKIYFTKHRGFIIETE